MSERVGLLALSTGAAAEDAAPPWSEALVAEIDGQTRALFSTAHGRAKAVLCRNRAVLDAMAVRPVETETIDGSALAAFLVQVDPVDTGVARPR